MIHTMVFTKSLEMRHDIPINELGNSDVEWYWADFENPTDEEAEKLISFFGFHPLAVEDCLNFLQRPKLDYYEEYTFFVLHGLNEKYVTPIEIDLFVGEKYLVSFHKQPVPEISMVWNKFLVTQDIWTEGSIYAVYQVMDKLVDHYFPAIYALEDQIDVLNNKMEGRMLHQSMDQLFEIRGRLLKLRRIINSMGDLLYRILNSSHLESFKSYSLYFSDIHDHLLKLSEMIDSNRDMTSDIRDSYLSRNSDRMNKVMMILTAITAIFVPLTFIAGVYGMNFKYMPELDWRYGYFIVLGVMGLIALLLFLWFKFKGWFNP